MSDQPTIQPGRMHSNCRWTSSFQKFMQAILRQVSKCYGRDRLACEHYCFRYVACRAAGPNWWTRRLDLRLKKRQTSFGAFVDTAHPWHNIESMVQVAGYIRSVSGIIEHSQFGSSIILSKHRSQNKAEAWEAARLMLSLPARYTFSITIC